MDNQLVTLWSWLFPVIYLLHIAEEHWGGGGYCAHLAHAKGVRLTQRRFLFLTGMGLVLMIAGLRLAAWYKFPQLLLVILGSLLLANGLSHAWSGVREGRYHPGLVSGVFVWIPTGLLTLISLAGDMRWPRYLAGMALGLAIQVIVSWLSLSGGKITATKASAFPPGV